jgi:hypothetical protein
MEYLDMTVEILEDGSKMLTFPNPRPNGKPIVCIEVFGPLLSKCWIAISHGSSSGGYPKTNGKRVFQVLYERYIGQVNAYCLRHICDDRGCVNPEHGIPGTHRENMRDMAERGGGHKINCMSTIIKESEAAYG